MPDVNHRATVDRVAAHQSPGHTLESSLAFTLAVLAELPPSEQAGLKKSRDGASSTLAHRGTFVRVNRISYPDGITYKILTDTPGTNGLAWNVEDGGATDPDAYVALDGGSGDHAAEEPDPPSAAPGTSYDDSEVVAFAKECEALLRPDAGRVGVNCARMEHDANVQRMGYTASRAKHLAELKRELGR